MKPNSIVIANLAAPRQRFFGRLIDITTAGVTIRGIDLDAFEDWIDNIAGQEESGVQPTTTFFPLHRVEKIILDEGNGPIPSLSNTFWTRLGASIEIHLE